MRRPPCCLRSGFTLIEVVSSLALFAAALVLLLSTLSNASRQIRFSEDAGRAALHAQSLLAQVGVGERLRPERREGELDGGRYRWRLHVEPFSDPLADGGAAAGLAVPRMLQLDLTVSWGDDEKRRLQWRTLRLAPVDAGAAP